MFTQVPSRLLLAGAVAAILVILSARSMMIAHQQPPASNNPPPPPPPPVNTSNAAPPPPPPPPGPPNHALEEIRHANDSIAHTSSLIEYARSHGVNPPRTALELLNNATQFYNIAKKLLNENRLVEAEVYAHIAVEMSHGAEHIVQEALRNAGVAPPPPPPPPPPPRP